MTATINLDRGAKPMPKTGETSWEVDLQRGHLADVAGLKVKVIDSGRRGARLQITPPKGLQITDCFELLAGQFCLTTEPVEAQDTP